MSDCLSLPQLSDYIAEGIVQISPVRQESDGMLQKAQRLNKELRELNPGPNRHRRDEKLKAQ